MDFLLQNAWLAVVVPFAIAALVGLFGRFALKAAPWVTLIAPAWVFATGLAWVSAGHDAHAAGSADWLFAQLGTPMPVGWEVVGLTALMLLVVGLVATMVVLFSIGYMADEDGLARYFALLALFTGSMTMLVIADGLVGLFIGWELVGACSYMLIGFWFNKPSASAAAVKAFLTTRVGDVGLLLGIALLWREIGALDYASVFASIESLAPGTITVVALMLFIGAAGKSAQFPLHIWLPDAMEGPTPVSALIHAATMVAAGVFLIARTWPIFEATADARMVVLYIGAFTALASATIAVAQTDIKKVLAYSTISQLGFMFAALGAGAWVPAIFHLTTHAAFKALLFLGSGSVIHGTGTQDLRRMGGLRKTMPVTAVTWIIGSLALAGVPPLAGFFSKDEVIHAVWGGSPIAGMALLFASLLTAFYITRATKLAFFGEFRGEGHPHEGGWVMSLPLITLAIPALAAGFAGHWIAEILGEHGESLDPTTAVVSSVVALVGIGAAWFAYRDDAASETDMASRGGATWALLADAYRFDALVSAAIIRPTVAVAGWLYRVVDRAVIDATAEGIGTTTRKIGAWLSGIQGGDAQWYAALLGAGAVSMLALALLGLL